MITRPPNCTSYCPGTGSSPSPNPPRPDPSQPRHSPDANRRSRRALRLLHSFSAMDNRRRPIGGAAGKAVFDCFAVMIDGHGLLDESGSIIETVDVDHCAEAAGVS